MKPLLFPTAFVVLFCQLAYGRQAGTKYLDAPPLQREEVIKQRSGLHKRVNGLLMTISARVTGKKDATIEVAWSLDYNGPRPPLIIIQPTLTDGNATTVVRFFGKGKDGRFYEIGITGSIYPGINPTNPDKYIVTVRKGKSMTDYLEIETKELRETFQKTYPNQFADGPPELFLQLDHHPCYRGDRDAWTGQLYSQLIEQKLPKW